MRLLDRLLTDKFIQQVKSALTMEDGEVLAVCYSADLWAWLYMIKPNNMHRSKFNAYSKTVGKDLVLQEILIGRDPLRLRLSRKWYDENRKKEEAR